MSETNKYARVGPPFNFLGHMTESQRNAMFSWMKVRESNFNDIATFHQIRAQQLRKSAGLLEHYYANYSLDQPTPTFQKNSWKPAAELHFLYSITGDQLPAAAVSSMKEPYKEQLQIDEEAVFWMNWVRNAIEKQEDKAQQASEAISTISKGKTELTSYFTDPTYSQILISQADESKYRTNQFDQPTSWEVANYNHTEEEF